MDIWDFLFSRTDRVFPDEQGESLKLPRGNILEMLKFPALSYLFRL